MRRIALIAVTALTALACALLPSGALAHGHHRGHHYARRARHHDRHFHARLYGAGSAQQPTGNTGSTGSTGSSSSGTETLGPTTSSQPGDAGKIVSFTEGVLTIQMGEGEKATTISGKVTEETEIHCIPAPPASTTTPSSSTAPSGEDGGSDGSQGQQSEPSWGEPGWGHDDQGSGDDGEGDRNQEGGSCQCSTANLTPGTVVQRAELLLTESGAVFREIELVH